MSKKHDAKKARDIKTDYYNRKNIVRETRSLYANNAVPNCIKHMQLNEYDATHAEVYDTSTGVLHAVIKRKIRGDIVILFKREVEEGM